MAVANTAAHPISVDILTLPLRAERMWSVVSGSLTDCGKIHVLDSAVNCICVSSGGLVGAASESRLVLGHLGSRMGQAKLRVKRLVMSPDNTTVLTVDTDGHMHLIDLFGKHSNPN
ncbi:hypothetical protein J6590_006775 [Homalodisca vitripennis]|nr:hypothetical protein J6590_006775 [Homalodisca vitripennis]